MAIPDISGLSLDELGELLLEANLAFKQSQADSVADTASRKEEVLLAIARLETLLGTPGVPNLTSIRGVLTYTDTQMAQNAGLAFRLAFQGMEQLTETVLHLAHVLSKQ